MFPDVACKNETCHKLISVENHDILQNNIVTNKKVTQENKDLFEVEVFSSLKR